ncbi:MAG: hypothetical protein ACI90V_003359, partial [Bacillariaceae sp.]
KKIQQFQIIFLGSFKYKNITFLFIQSTSLLLPREE